MNPKNASVEPKIEATSKIREMLPPFVESVSMDQETSKSLLIPSKVIRTFQTSPSLNRNGSLTLLEVLTLPLIPMPTWLPLLLSQLVLLNRHSAPN